MASFYSKECVKPLHKVLLIQDKSDPESVRWKSAIWAHPGVLKEREPLRKHLPNTLSSANINTQNTLPSLKICTLNTRIYSHLRRASPPALVSHAEAAKALSLGHLVLPRALVLPTGNWGGGFLLQLRQMLHAAVHLQGETVRSITIGFLS